MQKKNKLSETLGNILGALFVMAAMSFFNTVLAKWLGDFFAYMFKLGDSTPIGMVLFLIFVVVELVVAYSTSLKKGE